jgi:hypothetical protein
MVLPTVTVVWCLCAAFFVRLFIEPDARISLYCFNLFLSIVFIFRVMMAMDIIRKTESILVVNLVYGTLFVLADQILILKRVMVPLQNEGIDCSCQ